MLEAASYVAPAQRAWASDVIDWGIYDVEEADLGCSRTSSWTVRTSSSSVAVRPTSPPGSPGVARGRSASTSLRPSSRRRGACSRSTGWSSRSSRPAPRTCRSRTRASTSRFSEYGASIWCDPYRWIPEAARLLRPGGRLIFLSNSILSILCSPDDETDRRHARPSVPRAPPDRLAREGRGHELPPRLRGHGPVAAPQRPGGRGLRRALRSRGRDHAVTRGRTTNGRRSGRSRRSGRPGSGPDVSAPPAPPLAPRLDVAAAPRDPGAARDPVRGRRAQL